MRVALLANLQSNAPEWPDMPPDQWHDLDSEKTLHSIVGALESNGHSVTFLEGDVSLFDNLRKLRPDICFNLCEGHFGDTREAQAPAVLEMLRIPYTGSRILTLALTLDKPMTKRVLAFHGLPTPAFQVFEDADEALNPELSFPLFVKPSREGTGMGVTGESVVQCESELRARVEGVLHRYGQPALVEQFIDGREVTVGAVGNLGRGRNRQPESRGLHVFPALEVDMTKYPPEERGIYTNRIKVEMADTFYTLCPAPLRPEQVEELNRLTVAVFQATGCLDVARVDFRLDGCDGERPYILEVNPLPGLNPKYSDLCIEAEADGWSYEQLINRILDEAAARYGLT